MAGVRGRRRVEAMVAAERGRKSCFGKNRQGVVFASVFGEIVRVIA